MALRKRTRAREIALQHLFANDVREDKDELDIDGFLRIQTRDDDIYLFALGLIHGCLRSLDEVDREISKAAIKWKSDRLSAVDRNVLRLATYELLHRPDIPAQVTINEGIELAKRFSTEKSGAFVNGVLDRIREDLGREPEKVEDRADEMAPEPTGETEEGQDDEPA